MIEILF